MEPVEINAGAWYLRGVQADTGYRWDVCEPITGEVVAAVTLDPATGLIGMQAQPGHAEAAQTAADAVRRFADAAFGDT
ncbi:hypothetical protein CQY20_10765 [Mycolicibacterium agri]|uniref:Uncharacterized protein n=1 Tax=Mycolicibacterium agri TaxID=36811 RepID=A0A2A7N685_MYCAG|nr:hypothetical protein [Mycolicibacterium agri]PEG39360.1 hypothetical protein CQY20_10765 [Mycolicibacterium agri]GFG51744.1 hypothetical protein MAGR_31850 [Mycolicibacterium agri]